MSIKIASLNLCLGLPNKKNLVKQLILNNNIDVLCLQETEIENNIDHNLMSFNNFNYESESNNKRSRVGCYISTSLNYVRRSDLEESDLHIVIIDIKSIKNLRIINVYRPFNPLIHVNPRTFFNNQLQIIRNAYTRNTILLGDFNLDWNKKGAHEYAFKNYFNDMSEKLNDVDMIQLVKFPTWSRIVNGVLRESLLDHVYSNNPLDVINLHKIDPICGDHCMVVFSVKLSKLPPTYSYRRNWKNYDKSKLCESLNLVDWSCNADSVQGCWNDFENKLLGVVDCLIPLTCFSDKITSKQTLPSFMKNKYNLRKRLLRIYREKRDETSKERLKQINNEIKTFHNNLQSNKVRKAIVPGNTKSLWKAVKIAKDTNTNVLPKTLFRNGLEIEEATISDEYASFFDQKIRGLVNQVVIDDHVFNGSQKVVSHTKMFMDLTSVKECLLSLKNKKTEGMDRIPQCVLLDGADVLSQPLTELLRLIYHEKNVPDQWLVAKTIPVYKNKGNKKDIENYRPIANLCAASKIFEKLILKRILEIQETNGVDLTGTNQHGFKKAHSTSTLSAEIQSLIARALDDDEYVLLASLDLSSAFDLVDVNLLLKRLKKIGLPSDLIDLISVWLKNRSFYVSIDGQNSTLFDLLLGTVQGSILGPILYAIFVSPMFDLCDLSSFADDNFIPRCNKDLPSLVTDMERSLDSITKWLIQSGMKVNNNKTEICLFYKNDVAPVTIVVDNTAVKSKSTINILGVLFDCKLQWGHHVNQVIHKANKALNAIKLIRKFFKTSELVSIVTSNFYSILFYNSEIWHLPNLNVNLKHALFVASANCLKMCLNYPNEMISYQDLHKLTNRATPEMLAHYKLALSLYKVFNDKSPLNEWLHLNFTQINTTRQTSFMTSKANKLKLGMNCLSNRFNHLNGKIPLLWLNKSFDCYKIECKKLFLKF